MPTRIAETGLLTAATLTIIAILAIVTALGIVWGMRLKRQRADADRIEEARVEDEGGEQRPPTALSRDEAPAPMPSPPPPVAPSPPPVDDGPVFATPAPERGEAPEPSLADEPVAAAAPLDASPAGEAAPEPAPEPAAAPQPAPDRPVTDIKGLGPKVAALLAEHGITNVAQIAALDASEAEHLDAHLGPFTGRMSRDRWIEQARFLAAGDVKGFEAVFGRL